MRSFRPLANNSRVSAEGETFPFMIRCIVDFVRPVIIDTWRMLKFRLSIISASNIFILIFYDINFQYVAGNYW